MPGNYVLLETIEITQTTSSVTFDNIPQTGYTDLVLKASARSTRAGLDEDGFTIKLNASTSGYTYKTIIGTGTGVTNLNTSYEQTWAGEVNAGSSTANVFNNLEAYIPNYAGSSAKSYMVDAVQENNGTAGYISMNSVLQSSTSAITSITCGAANGNVLAGSTFSLYGVAKLGTTPAVSPKATGGNIVANDGTYWYHAFLTSGTFTPQTALTCDALVVAGGGGGGYDRAAGGGAGGFRTTTSLSVSSATAVTVGAGGAGQISYSVPNAVGGVQGNSSIFSTITSAGGGAGANASTGGNGGSGGGGYGQSTYAGGAGNTPSTSPSQGNNGGTSIGAPYYHSGGGGGAGAVGANASSAGPGAGGIGSSTAISGGAATGMGQLSSGTYYFAGGGGSGGNSSPTPTNGSAGGLGGGGAGGNQNSNGVAGIASTGGGGGGGGNIAQGTGGNGGSGIVIIRYPMV